MPLSYQKRSCGARRPLVLALFFAAFVGAAAVESTAHLITRPIYPFHGLLDAVMVPVSRAWSVGLAAGVLTAQAVPQAPLTGDAIRADMDAASALSTRFSPLVGVRILWRF
ncbi:MAG: hypothetical protein M0Z85_09825 [Gammaproteobacteria bacterium]|nr:hypothetical protein [Gammaproteobacteria bacterium]